ncbi:toll-like receptor 2 [Ptychodera flava]|uniref:toll-like receptor 2 n=1 Tax=Ptychodera flava TaxID=63121 RepID=UPI00396A0A7F
MIHTRLLKIYAALLYLVIRMQILLTDEIPLTCQVYNITHLTCKKLSILPRTFPSWITHLELSNNHISSIEPNGLAQLANLKELKLDGNRIKTLRSQSFDGLDQLVVLLLNRSRILTIQSGSFRTLYNLQTLDLSDNKLGVIPNNTFSGLSNLISLHLAYNGIHSIFTTSFSGLTNLLLLTLGTNKLSILPNGVFDDLVSLRVLDLNDNSLTCTDTRYFHPLVNIQTIMIDDLDFSDCTRTSFVHTPTLEYLSIRMSNISDHLLKELRFPNNRLRHVDLSYNKIDATDSGTLLSLTDVVSLDLSFNPLLPDSLERLLGDLKDSNIKTLILDRLGNENEQFSELKPTTFRWLRSTKLEYLHLSINNLTTLPANVFTGLHHLKYLNLFRSKVRTLTPNTFIGLTNLTTLQLSYNYISDITEVKQALKHLKSLEYLDLSINKITEISSFAFEGVPQLEKLLLNDNLISVIRHDSFRGLNKVYELDLTKNRILYIPDNTFLALPSLRILKLRHNELTNTSHEEVHRPFGHLKNLTELSISYSRPIIINLQDVHTITRLELANDYHLLWAINEVDLAMVNLTRLEILDIDEGKVVSLPKTTPIRILRYTSVQGAETDIDFVDFAKHPWLEEISIVSDNVNIKYTGDTKFKLLHLKTLILDPVQMLTFDTKILDTSPNLETFSFFSPQLDCSCGIKDFSDWMRTNRKVRVNDVDGIRCKSPLEVYKKPVYELEFGLECSTVTIVGISLTCVVVTVVCVVLLVHYRWYLLHAIFLIKLKIGRYQLADDDDIDGEANKKYDAFVVYNGHDNDWVMGQLRPNLENGDPPNFKLCLHERDFLPGTDIFENIINSIDSSHKTVLVLSPHFAVSEWCYFEMRMAQNQLFDSRRDVLVMILLEEIPDDDMPRILHNILLIKRFLKWPDNRMDRERFWQKLRLELKSDSRVNRVADV